MRLAQHAHSFDAEFTLINSTLRPLSHAMLNALMPLPDFGSPTFIVRDGDIGFAAQFRHRSGQVNAKLGFIAPNLDHPYAEEAWFTLIETMIAAAGRRGAHTLNAEVDENSDAFQILRRSGFAVYTRQDVWRREPGITPDGDPDLLRPALDSDAFGINCLYVNLVPRLVMQADAPPDPTRGLVYEQGGRLAAFLSITEGRAGIYVQPYIHPEMDHCAGAIHAAALARLGRVQRLPVYIMVRRYQDWLRTPLSHLGFEAWGSQAVMVKHTVARIEHPTLAALPTLRTVASILPTVKLN
jgi:hypothetical protein